MKFEIQSPPDKKLRFLSGFFIFHKNSIITQTMEHTINKKYFILSAILFSFFLIVAWYAVYSVENPLLNFDNFVNSQTENFRNDNMTVFMQFATDIGDKFSIIIFTIISLTILALRKRWSEIIIWIIGIGGIVTITEILKDFFVRTRPEDAIIAVGGWSFPSGHTTMATAFFFLIIWSFSKSITNKLLKYFFVITFTIIPSLILISRLYLGVHWFSDILGGMLISMSFILLTISFSPLIEKISKKLPQ